jgi:hypothetical protein
VKSILIIFSLLIIFGCKSRDESGKSGVKSATTGKEKYVRVKIKGKVLNADDRTAIPGALIMVPGTTTGTVTDDKGQFIMQVQYADTLKLVFAGMGFESVKLIVNPEIENIIFLKHTAE